MACCSISEASGDRIYVIGDIHGCLREAVLLLSFLEHNESLTDDDLVIFLGDYIDRGPHSKEVVDLMLEFKKGHPKARFLKGNHEDMILDFLGFGGSLGQSYLYNGGLETIQSYGMTVFSPPEEMVKVLPPEHLEFYMTLDYIIRVDNYICVHAGLNPLRDLDAQNDSDVLWIRNEFLNSVHDFEYTVVFGHTPHQEIVADLPYKLGLDTGLVFGNKLSCVELRSGTAFQVVREGEEVRKGVLDLFEDTEASPLDQTTRTS